VPSRFGPPIVIEQEMRTGAVSYWQGDYYQSRADKNGVSLLNYIHALFGLVRQKKSQSVLMIGCGGGSLATMLARAAAMSFAVDLNRRLSFWRAAISFCPMRWNAASPTVSSFFVTRRGNSTPLCWTPSVAARCLRVADGRFLRIDEEAP
jgi:hypothetical protein